MEAKEFYYLANDPSLAGRVAKALVYVYKNVQPPRFTRDEKPMAEDILERHSSGRARILILGSNLPPEGLGGLRAHDVTQIDLKAHPHVDVVADAERLTETFPKGSFDYVISTSMLEHTQRPWKVVEESYAVLREGGLFFISAPWMFPLHMEPHDYWRFSRPCLKNLVEAAGFTEIEGGSAASPHHALHVFLLTYFSEIFSMGKSTWYYSLHYAFSWLLFPLGILESHLKLGVRKHYYTDSMVYIVARKPVQPASPTKPGAAT